MTSLPDLTQGVKNWLSRPAHYTAPSLQPEPRMPEPIVSVPVTSTNLVVNQTFTELLTSAQVLAGIVIGAFASDPSGLASISKGWPAWLAVAAAGALQYLKTKYLSNSNAATIALASSVSAQASTST